MIPKNIIYCWFGKKEKSEKVLNCINTWKQNMPDWNYIEINEDNFDININDYCKEAYNSKAWAFVSDIARLWALYKYGGIYMDTDVEVFKPLDKFLDNNCFTGFENVYYPVTALIGAEKENELIKELLDEYKNRHFELKKDWTEYETNTVIMSNIISKYINRNINELQISEKITVYPKKYFTSHETIDDEVYAKHNMFGSWIGGIICKRQ